MAVTLEQAADICRPLDRRTFQDQTLDLADKLIGEANREIAQQERDANVGQVFLGASYTLETAAINLRAYTRGMVGKDVLPSYIKQAREALDAMEAAVSQ